MFRGGLEFQAHRPLYHSTLGSEVIKKADDLDMALRRSHMQRCPPLRIGVVH